MSTMNGHQTSGRPVLRDTLYMTEEPGSLTHAATAPVQYQWQSPITPSMAMFRQRTMPSDLPSNPNIDPARKWTQQDQDKTDEEARRRIMKELERSWMDRLQLISVITTFFAAIEAQLLGITTPDPGTAAAESRIEQTANATLAGALVVHVFAAILSFLAAFFLIRYRLREVTREEVKIESGITPISSHSQLADGAKTSGAIWSSRPQLEAVGPFRRGTPPTHLLDHCHTLCMWLAAVGFVLAMAGVLCFAWARLPRSGSIFASVCMGICCVAGVTGVLFVKH